MQRTTHRSALAGALVLVLLAAPALAHGPGVEVGIDGVAPAELHVPRGTTVHFHNRDERPLRVRGDDQSFLSPVLGPGEGWHLPLPFPGRFPYRVEGAEGGDAEPGARGVIVVEGDAP